jgi:hypothetical protein
MSKNKFIIKNKINTIIYFLIKVSNYKKEQIKIINSLKWSKYKNYSKNIKIK